MKVANIVAVALGTMAATSEAVKLNAQYSEWYDEFKEIVINEQSGGPVKDAISRFTDACFEIVDLDRDEELTEEDINEMRDLLSRAR